MLLKKFFFPFGITLLLLGCGADRSTEEVNTSSNNADVSAPTEVIFRRGNGAEPGTLDPHLAEGTVAADLQRDLFEGLTSASVTAETTPGVAERWEISEDGLIYMFYLRENAKWSNGDPVVAADFVAGLQRSVDPATGSNYSMMLGSIKNAVDIINGEKAVETLGVEAVDERTLKVELASPTPYFVKMLSHSTTYPLHRASFNATPQGYFKPGTLISNGPFKLDEWKVQSHIKVSRNVHYWDNDNVHIDTVFFYPLEDQSVELKRFRAGELDYTNEIPKGQIKWIRENMSDELYVAPYLGTYYYAMNMFKPPFKDNRELRQALIMAVDREILTSKVLGVGEVPAYGLVPPGVDGYQSQSYTWANLSKEAREEEAKQLYVQAGYSADAPLKLRLIYNTSENHKRVAVAIARMWKEVLGIEVDLLNEEWKVMLQTRNNPDAWEVLRFGWVGDYNDAFTFSEIFHSEHGQNYNGYANPEYDKLLTLATQEADLELRASYLKQSERLFLEDYAFIPLYFYVSAHMVAPHVKGYQPNVMNHDYSKHYRIER